MRRKGVCNQNPLSATPKESKKRLQNCVRVGVPTPKQKSVLFGGVFLCDVGAASRAAGSHDQEAGTHYRGFLMGIDSGEGNCPRGVRRLNV